MSSPEGKLRQLERWLRQSEEHERLEFKHARTKFDFTRLVQYCVALANEGGGHLILGVSDHFPRKVLGSSAFEGKLQKVKANLTQALKLIRVDAYEVMHPDGRVVVFDVPARPLGLPLHYEGRYFMRGGEGLIAMTPDQLRAILDEASPDYSSETMTGVSIADLSVDAVERFRILWAEDSGNSQLLSLPVDQLLRDAGLVTDQGITIAALVLLGTSQTLGQRLGQAEIIFEYRSQEHVIHAQQRMQFRDAFLLIYDDLWNAVSLRNEVFELQTGLIRRSIPSFHEEVVREAILNAVAHRDYRLPGSIYIRQFPSKLEIESPGGLPAGITPENILWRREPRNRLLAETLERCGFVERSGQGMDIMFRRSIADGKAPPDLTGSDEYLVRVVLSGHVRDPRFIHLLEAISREIQYSVTVEDLLVLNCIHGGVEVPEQVRNRQSLLVERGILERIGRGRGTRYLLSRRFHHYVDEAGAYTRRRGLDRATNKELLVRHLKENQQTGSRFRDLHQVLPSLSRNQVQSLLRELQAEGRAHSRGVTRAARWYPGPATD